VIALQGNPAAKYWTFSLICFWSHCLALPFKKDFNTFTTFEYLFKVGVTAIVGVTELKSEFDGMLALHKRFGFDSFFNLIFFHHLQVLSSWRKLLKIVRVI